MKNKFKTLKLFIIFIIIIVIAIFALGYAKKLFIEKENNDIKTNMLLIQGKIKLIKGEAEVNKNEEGYVGIKLSESDNEQIKELLKKFQITEENFANYYILNKEHFEKMGISEELKDIDDNEYIVNYNEAEVIYVKGININGTQKYKLSEILAKEEKPKWLLFNKIEI